jgi:AraC family carnitine catabolism transcriptional activator
MPAERAPHAIAFVLIPRFNMMALTTSLEPLRVANYIVPRRLYDWTFLSVDSGPVTASNGMSLDTRALDSRDEGPWDAIIVCGSWDSEHYENPRLFGWLRRMARRGVTLGSMDIGVYILARAKLMAGYRATTHWYCVKAFAEAYPDVEAVEQLYVIDRGRMTCAGGTAGLDMMLHDLEERHGRQLALEVADQIMHYPIREAEAPQRRTLGGKEKAMHPTVRQAIALMEANLEDQLSVPDVAAQTGVSQRKLERLFKRYMGSSVIGFYQMLRLQHARSLLNNTELSVRDVSVACGFASLSYFSKSFTAHFGKRPREYREAWPEADPDPAWPGTPLSLAGSGRARRYTKGHG